MKTYSQRQIEKLARKIWCCKKKKVTPPVDETPPVVNPLVTITWSEDEEILGEGETFYSSILGDIEVPAGATLYVQADMIINTTRAFFDYYRWILADDAFALEWSFEVAIPDGSSTGMDYIGSSEGDYPLQVSGTVTNNADSPLYIKLNAFSHDSYFGGTGGNIIRSGSTFKYSTNPIP